MPGRSEDEADTAVAAILRERNVKPRASLRGHGRAGTTGLWTAVRICHILETEIEGGAVSRTGTRAGARRGERMKIAALAGAVAAVLTISTAQAAVRIKSDPGGQIGPYLENLTLLRGSGERVIIDGPCLSACTMVLGVIPRERICVTPRARLGFHAAWHPGENGQRIPSREATKLLMHIYPAHVRSWIARRGGLTPRMKYLSGRELAAMYNTCE